MRFAPLVLLPLALAAASCNQSLSTAPTAPSTTGSTLNVILKDTPFGDAKAVIVTFAQASAQVSSGDFVTLPLVGASTTRSCDLKSIQKTSDVLATGTLPIGHYLGVRLIVTSATIYFDNQSAGEPCADTIGIPGGKSAVMDIPSGDVRISQPFDINATTATTVTLDFNGDASIAANATGGYTLTPVVTPVSVN